MILTITRLKKVFNDMSKTINLVLLVCVLVLSCNQVMSASLVEIMEPVVVIRTDIGHGSGVILTNSGTVVTNAHVLEGATTVSIELENGDVYSKVDFLAADGIKDIVLLKVYGFDLPAAKLGNSNAVKAGQTVYAVGSPKGYDGTISRGIISAVRKNKKGFKQLQLDAAISPGSSGGGVFNENNELIGIAVSYIDEAQNLNFAIPINYIRGLMDVTSELTLSEYLANSDTYGVSNQQSNAIKIQSLVDLFAEELESDTEALEEYDIDSYMLSGKYGKFVLQDMGQMLRFSKIYDTADRNWTFSDLNSLLLDSFNGNYAKIGLDGSGNLSLTLELFAADITASQVKAVTLGLMALQLQVLETLDDEVNDPTVLIGGDRSSYASIVEAGSDSTTFTMLDDQITFAVPNYFKETSRDQDADDDSERMEFTGDQFSLVFLAELADLDTYEVIPELLKSNTEDVGTKYKVLESGFRTVAGRKLYWSQQTYTIEGFNVAAETNVYLGEGLVLQVILTTRRSGASRLSSASDSIIKSLQFSR